GAALAADQWSRGQPGDRPGVRARHRQPYAGRDCARRRGPHVTRRRVAVTGLGLVTPIGIGRSAVWQRLGEQRSAVTAVTRFDPSPLRSRGAAQIDDFDPAERLDARQAPRTDRCSPFALVAPPEALEDPGLAGA